MRRRVRWPRRPGRALGLDPLGHVGRGHFSRRALARLEITWRRRKTAFVAQEVLNRDG